MTSVNPIAGNNGFSKIESTLVNTNNVAKALQNAGLSPLKIVEGSITPLGATDSYPVLTAAGVNVTLPANALVSHIFLRGSSDLAGGTDAQPVLSLTAGGAAVTNLSAAVVLANLKLGYSPAVTALAGDAVNQYLSIKTTGTYTAGTIDIAVLYM
jgi:hypothetical protein